MAEEGGLELGQEEKESSPCQPRPLQVSLATELVEIETDSHRREEEEQGGRERLPSNHQREMSDTLTPLTDALSARKPFPFHRGSTTSSLRSTTSSARRGKPPPLLRSEPQHILRVKVRGMSILPNIQANEVSVRASLSHVKVAEILANNSRERNKTPEPSNEGIWEGAPVIRARIEIGTQVQRFDLPPSQDGKAQEVVAMLSIRGLRAALLAKNAAVVKDFFDDEFEADDPIPIQLHLEDTTFELREELQHTAESEGTMNVKIKTIDVHRGRQITGTNLFLPPASEAVLSPRVEDTLRPNSGQLPRIRDTSPAALSTDGSTNSAAANSDLLETFRSFVRVFESHVRRHGGLKVQLNEPEHIAGLLQELQVSLGDEEIEAGKTSEAPPTYSETVKQDVSSVIRSGNAPPPSPLTPFSPSRQQRKQSLDSPTAKSRASELRRLRQDSHDLSRILSENEDLISQLKDTKMLLAERSQDLDEVTSECKKAKEALVTHKQVLENYQEHIERLLTENADLKTTTTSSTP